LNNLAIEAVQNWTEHGSSHLVWVQLKDKKRSHLLHEITDPASVAPVAVLAVGHVDDVDLGRFRVGHPLHDVGAGARQSSASLHGTESAVSDSDLNLREIGTAQSQA